MKMNGMKRPASVSLAKMSQLCNETSGRNLPDATKKHPAANRVNLGSRNVVMSIHGADPVIVLVMCRFLTVARAMRPKSNVTDADTRTAQPKPMRLKRCRSMIG
jgi:hypothetical protein